MNNILLSKMVKKGLKRIDMANALNMNYNTFALKLKGEYKFNEDEIKIILKLTKSTFEEIFLQNEVDNVDKGA